MSSMRDKATDSMVFSFLEHFGTQLISFIVSIVLARILMPEEYGVVAIVIAFINITGVLVTYGFGNSLIQKKDVDVLDYSTVFWLNIALALGFYLLMFLFAPLLASYYNKPILSPLMRLLGLRLPFTAVNSVQNAYIAKSLQFRKRFLVGITANIFSGIVGIVSAFCGLRAYALVVQSLVSVILTCILLLPATRKNYRFMFSMARAKTLFAYGWKILLSGLVDKVYDEIRSLVIAKKYTSEDLAFYDKGKSFASLVANNINESVVTVIFPVMSIYQDDIGALKKAARNAMRNVSYILYPAMLGLAVVAKPLINLLLTDKWEFAAIYMQVFCIAFLFKPLKSINQSTYKAVGNSGYVLWLNLAEKGIGIAFLLAAMHYGVIWIAIAVAVSYFIAALMNMLPTQKLIGYTVFEQFADVLPACLLSLIMAAAAYVVGLLQLHPVLRLTLQAVTGAAVYIAASAVFKASSFNQILSYLKTRIFSRRKESREK